MSGVEMDMDMGMDVHPNSATFGSQVKWTGEVQPEAGPSGSRSVVSGSGMERSVSGSTEGSVVSHGHSSRKGKGRASVGVSVGEEEQDVEMDSGRRTRGALSLSYP